MDRLTSPPPEAPPDLIDLGVLAAVDGPLGLMLALADATDRGWSRAAYLSAVLDRARDETNRLDDHRASNLLAVVRLAVEAQLPLD